MKTKVTGHVSTVTKKSVVKSLRLYLALPIFFLHVPLLFFFSFPPSFTQWETQTSARVAFLVALALYLNVSFLYEERLWSVPSLTFLILALFHLGLFASLAITGELPSLVTSGEIESDWFYSGVASIALTYAIYGLIAYSAGLTLAVALQGSRVDSVPVTLGTENQEILRERFSVFGLCLLTVSIISWFAVSVTHVGPLFFLMSYMDYLRASQSAGILVYIYLGISYGLMFACFTRNKRRLFLSIVVFSVFGVCALFLGMRDNVMIPAVGAVAIWARVYNVKKSFYFIIVLFSALILIGAVRVVRRTGVADSDFTALDLTPWAAIEEMGFSMRVLLTTITWHDIQDEPYYWGVTYVSTLIRSFEKIFGGGIPSDQVDYRIMGNEITDRAGSIGGSMLAEAHHNFGVLGIVVIMLIFGILIGYFSLRPPSVVNTAIMGVLAVLFLMHVRNSFTPIPFWFAAGMIFIFLALKIPPAVWKIFNIK